MASSLSNLAINLSEGVHRIKCKFRHDDRKYKTCGIKYDNGNWFLKYINFKDDLIEYEYLCCNENYQHKFDENFKKRFFNTCKFSKDDSNNFILLLCKGAYPYK